MQFCPYCGKEIPDNVEFCPYCGARIHAEKLSSPDLEDRKYKNEKTIPKHIHREDDMEEKEERSEDLEKETKKQGEGFVKIIFFIISVILLFGIGYYIYDRFYENNGTKVTYGNTKSSSSQSTYSNTAVPVQSNKIPNINQNTDLTNNRVSPALTVYKARLSRRDHFNSNGSYLGKIALIIHQDRANLYKYGGDAEDQRDSYFHTLAARNQIGYCQIIPVGTSYRILKNRIINSTPLVRIRVVLSPCRLFIEILK